MATSERTLSEFLQHSGRLLLEVEEGEIDLRRRSGEDIVVMTASHREALHVLAGAFLAGSREPEIARAVLPWLGLLSLESQPACLEELRLIAGVALDTGRLGRLVEALRAWEATALATWDEQRNRERLGYDEDAPADLVRPRP